MTKVNRLCFLAAPILAFALAAPVSAQVVPINAVPSRDIGHPKLGVSTSNPNLVEGRELYLPQSVAVDPNGNYVYVADTLNNRVLAWKKASSFQNGAQADLVIGQRDRYSTVTWGPGTDFLSGLNAPGALAVDPQGNLWVADTGNNRILRFDRPFDDVSELVLAKLVVGQTSLAAKVLPNPPTAKSLALASGGSALRSAITFDAQGNMWVSDPGNHRVLRYPAAAVSGTQNAPDATVVLGQASFTDNTPLPATVTKQGGLATIVHQINTLGMRSPSGVALDAQGNLFVSDGLNRVLVFRPPFTNGGSADRVLGTGPGFIPTPTPPAINSYSLGTIDASNSALHPPEGIFTVGNTLFVIDTPAHRVLRFNPVDSWPTDKLSSPPANAVIGQNTPEQAAPLANRGQTEPSDTSLFSPVAGTYANGEVFIADSSNHRVLKFGSLVDGPLTSEGDPYKAKRVLGQVAFEYRSPNLIEGREFNFSSLGVAVSAAGVAIDTSSATPHLYVADPNNNRVLGFADATKVRPGDRADIVIGQVDFFRSLANSPTNTATERNDSGLYLPIGVAVDSNGDVWVSDSGNSRVLRFPNPFATSDRHANLVLGQADFTSRSTDATSRTMAAPWGLAFTTEGHLLVSDATDNRVLLFTKPFQNGMAATSVVGQSSFVSSVSGSGANRFNSPRGISTDADDRLYVADPGNNRVSIFSRVTSVQPGSDPPSAFAIAASSIKAPQSVVVNRSNGEIWVANTNGSGTGLVVYRFPKFDQLILSNSSIGSIAALASPLAVALDGYGDVYVADTLNRVEIHYPLVIPTHGATFIDPTKFVVRFTPGLYISLFAANYAFTDNPETFNSLPMPTDLADIQVLANDTPTRLTFVGRFQINALLQNNLPSSGTVEIQVIQKSTGRIIATTSLAMDVAAPGFFTIPDTNPLRVAALNQDNTVNGPSNRAPRGTIVQFFLTGAGNIPGAPAEGDPASGLIFTPQTPKVYMGSSLREAEVTYSGLAPGLVGVWQVNAKVPDQVAPTTNAPVLLLLSDRPSNGNVQGFVATFSVQ